LKTTTVAQKEIKFVTENIFSSFSFLYKSSKTNPCITSDSIFVIIVIYVKERNVPMFNTAVLQTNRT